jgi:cytoskeletal protein RodZ
MLVPTSFNQIIMNTKKILLYGGGAVFLGAVTFFVWSFFQKTQIPTAKSTAKDSQPSDSTDTSSTDDSQSNFDGANKKKKSLAKLDAFITKGS